MNYQEAQQYLDSLQMHKIKLGLEAMEAFLNSVERPDRRLRFVHVAGTNGKGSVSVNIVSVLALAGYRVGLFTSPHLSSVRERFRVNDQFISEEEFARLASRIRVVLGEDMITYFEFTTALALLWFEEMKVDLVVLETGLGGRLDATNVVTPLVSVITNVSMDHEAYLGNDLKSIAYEKAGIIKENVPLVSGVAFDQTLEVVEEKCLEKKTPHYLYGRDFIAEERGKSEWCWRGKGGELENICYHELQCGMRGDYQKANSSLAVASLVLLQKQGFKITDEHIREGLLAVRWPARLEYIVVRRSDKSLIGSEDNVSRHDVIRYLIDGAHNPAGVVSLQQTLEKEYSYRNLIVIWGAMEDKDISQTLPPIADMASTIILTKPQGERAAEPAMLQAVLSEKSRERSHLIHNVNEAMGYAEALAGGDDLIVIAGSLYLIGEIRAALVGELVN